MRPIAKKEEKHVFGEWGSYDAVRRSLVRNLGGYCAYCESPISVDIPIEHKAAKTSEPDDKPAAKKAKTGLPVGPLGFPKQASQLRNLLLACDACNSAKGARPNRIDAVARLQQEKAPPPWSENDLFLAALRSSVWPDKTPADQGQPELDGDQTYLLFEYRQEVLSQNQLSELGYVRELTDKQAKESWAEYPHQKVWVLPNLTYIADVQSTGGDPFLLDRVKKALQILQLNHYHHDDRASDRRTENRTGAYHTAHAALSDLAAVVKDAGGLSDAGGTLLTPVHAMMLAIRQAALATGFWSVWMSVFTQAFQSPVAPWPDFSTEKKVAFRSLLFLVYLEGERVAKNEVIFPGTDLGRVPGW